MWATLITVSIFGLIIGNVEAGPKHLPSYITACKRNDPELNKCCLEQARIALPHIVDGDKRYGIPSFKPMKLEKVSVNSGNLKIDLKDIELYGLPDADIQDLAVDLKKQSVKIVFKCPQIVILGKYVMDGKILVLPLNGAGDANVTIDNPVFTYTSDYKLVNKDGLDYAQLGDRNELSYDMTRVYFKFDNLFNGNEQLSKSTNEVLNAEWKTMVGELNPAVKIVVATIATTIVNGIVSRIPYEEVFV
ncbi:circadian clock-controlled protein daywake-like isoform X2 [Diabrotica virgifera virgifera]|uniref:Protein takeout-like n=1 Tax=Diabrotica virgifera virgifera TaxID=50390 RepID=A0ABM5KG74_DIAVI|nr:circadian clock-controlled protein daywake-like isoform X2 [Diabrotica virgifera virgifera]